MIANVIYKQVSEPMSMIVVESATLPLFTLNPEFAQTERTFMAGSTVDGFHVLAKVRLNNDKTKEKKVEGLLMKDKQGYFIMPNENLKEVEADSDKAIKELDKQLDKAAKEIKKFDPKEKLGFSYKQLAVIAAVAVVIIAISK